MTDLVEFWDRLNQALADAEQPAATYIEAKREYEYPRLLTLSQHVCRIIDCRAK